jgi:quinol monooxygenase YgiN
MNPDSVTVVVQISAKGGKESQVRKTLLLLVASSFNDPGCVSYDLHQALDNPARFLLHENWTSEALLEGHLQKPEFRAMLAKLKSIVVEPPHITLWKKIG